MALFGRLAREGIRLRSRGVVLQAEVPERVIGLDFWPALDHLIARHAASLAVTASLARRFGERASRARIAALLAELQREVPEILRETVGGDKRLAELIGSASSGPDLDLACVACCRGLAVRALRDGVELVGVLSEGDRDDRCRGRRHQAPDARSRRGCAASGGTA